MGETEKLLGKFMQSPVFLRFKEEVEREEAFQADRQKTAVELAELRRTRLDEIAAVQKVEAEAESKVNKLREDLQSAIIELGKAKDQTFSFVWNLDRKIRDQEATLWQTAPAELREKFQEIESQILRHKSEMPRVTSDGLSWPREVKGVEEQKSWREELARLEKSRTDFIETRILMQEV